MDELFHVIGSYVDVICISETKINSSFPEAQFIRRGFRKPFRLDITDTSGGMLVYVNSNIASRRLDYILPADIQIIPIEINIRKQKWLLISVYRPPSQNLCYFIDKLSSMLDHFANSYTNFIIMGDFNEVSSSAEISRLISTHGLFSLIRSPTCFKSIDWRCIDLILTNKKFSFQNTAR